MAPYLLAHIGNMVFKRHVNKMNLQNFIKQNSAE